MEKNVFVSIIEFIFSALILIISGLFVGAWTLIKFAFGILLAPLTLAFTAFISAVCLEAIGL